MPVPVRRGRGFKTLEWCPNCQDRMPIGGCIPAALSPSAVRVPGKRLRIFSFTYHTEHADNLPDASSAPEVGLRVVSAVRSLGTGQDARGGPARRGAAHWLKPLRGGTCHGRWDCLWLEP